MIGLLPSAEAAAWRSYITRGGVGSPTAPAVRSPAPVGPPPVTVDHLKTARTSYTSRHCPPCDVTWKGTDPCWSCGTEPTIKP